MIPPACVRVESSFEGTDSADGIFKSGCDSVR